MSYMESACMSGALSGVNVGVMNKFKKLEKVRYYIRDFFINGYKNKDVYKETENIGNSTRLPIKLYSGNVPKCAITNGAVNTVAIIDVSAAVHKTFKILFSGILGFITPQNQISPNIAANDN